MERSRVYTLLTAAGALPFVIGALLPLTGVDSIPLAGDLQSLVASYGLAIVSFLCGTHWAMQLMNPHRTPGDLFIASNVILLLTWAAFVIGKLPVTLLVQAIALAALLYIDHRLRSGGMTTGRYFRTRASATAAASLSLITIVVA